jgi:hypothetical protein
LTREKKSVKVDIFDHIFSFTKVQTFNKLFWAFK